MMPRRYDIVRVDPLAPRGSETMGSKEKFWFLGPDGRDWLFKRGREGRGEDWAEKIAAELASLLDLPHADVELAENKGERGTVSPSFAGDGELVHGNDLLFELDPSYPKRQSRRVAQYTIDNVLKVLSGPSIRAPDRTTGMSAVEVFIGYLCLDALIGNGDRHHENWGLLRFRDRVVLAPTYDHASSLGRELGDERRRTLLATGLERYAGRARSPFNAQMPQMLSPREAFLAASQGALAARATWRRRASSLSEVVLHQIIDPVHDERMSEDAKRFAVALVLQNQRALCAEI